MALQWLVVILVCAFLEAITVNLVTIWFIVSGIIALFVSFFIDSLVFQLAIFVIVGLLLLVTTRRPLQRMVNFHKENTNLDRLYGMTGVVSEEILKGKSGVVKVDGKYWTATSDEDIPVDSFVTILEINSTKLKVKKVED